MKRSGQLLLAGLFAVIVLSGAVQCLHNGALCNGTGSKPSMVIGTTAHRLILCEGNKLVKTYRVAIGKGGVEKRMQGDDKTPHGIYSLGIPRRSEKYHQFIPIGYPTPAQVRAGMTGSAVRIHGPPRSLKWLGVLNTFINWTKGCVAVGRDKDIDEISEWLMARGVRRVQIK